MIVASEYSVTSKRGRWSPLIGAKYFENIGPAFLLADLSYLLSQSCNNSLKR